MHAVNIFIFINILFSPYPRISIQFMPNLDNAVSHYSMISFLKLKLNDFNHFSSVKMPTTQIKRNPCRTCSAENKKIADTTVALRNCDGQFTLVSDM